MKKKHNTARLGLVMTAVIVWACDTGDPNEARRMPKPPPPEGSAAFAQIGEIEVIVDGGAKSKVDAARLDATPADFTSEDRRAWRFSTLLGARVDEADAVLAVTGEKGLVLELPRAASAGAPIPVLIVSRRGEVMAAMVEADDPFPQYHGRGGRLGRRGDPLPRISGVTKIEITSRR